MNAPSSPSLRLGVTGHRLNKLDAEKVSRLKREVGEVLALLKHEIDEDPPVSRDASTCAAKLQIISPLAEGADRIVAEAALEQKAELIALLPFARNDYSRDFAENASREAFYALMARASEVLEPTDHPGVSREAGYARVGAQVVKRSDMLIALWDGRKASGTGGTAQIVALARRSGRPVLWVPTSDSSDQLKTPRLLLKDRVIGDDAVKAFVAIAKSTLARQLG